MFPSLSSFGGIGKYVSWMACKTGTSSVSPSAPFPVASSYQLPLGIILLL